VRRKSTAFDARGLGRTTASDLLGLLQAVDRPPEEIDLLFLDDADGRPRYAIAREAAESETAPGAFQHPATFWQRRGATGVLFTSLGHIFTGDHRMRLRVYRAEAEPNGSEGNERAAIGA
jgi:hypothetical protein